MKIGIYSPYLDTLTGGELYVLSIAEFLSKKHDVTVFWDDKDILSRATLRFGLSLDNVNLTSNIFNKKFSAGKKILSTLNYDRIIYLSDGSVPLLFPRKLIIHFQFPILRKNVSSFEIAKVNLSKSIFCNSEFTKEIIDKTYGVKSTVIYPPVKPIKASIKEKKNTIITVGRFQPFGNNDDFKKIGFMIKVFKKIKLDGWKFIIVTSVKQEYEKEFEKIEKEISENVQILKNASRSEVEDAYKEAKIYWHAAGYGEDLEKNPERAEHFGISTAEAMSAGCVPVVINAGGQSEIVDNSTGFLWNSENELMEFTKKLTADSSLREKLGKEAEKKANEFSIEKFYKKLESII